MAGEGNPLEGQRNIDVGATAANFFLFLSLLDFQFNSILDAQ